MKLRQTNLALSISSAILSGAFAMGGLTQTAYAQTVDPAGAAAPAGSTVVAAPATTNQSADDAGIARVIVTAQNRSQQLQDVPISVQVISGDQINKLAASNIADLNGYIPGLVVNDNQPTQPNYTIRGVGSGDTFVGTDAPVGIYVDGVYTGKTGGALMNFNDVERVEVLKGPQGTLFGRNSAAGAISVVSKEPSNEFENDYNARVGEYGEKYIDALLNVPLNDTMAFRFSFVDHRSNGWLTDASTGDSLNDQGDWGTRASVRWNAPEHTKVIFTWEHESLNQEARPDIGMIPVSQQTPFPPFPANPNNFVNPLTAPAYNNIGDNVEKRLYNGVTLRVDHPFDWATLDSTTAYRHFNSSNITDNTGTTTVNSYLDTGNVETNTTWQQEFRLSGKNDIVDWLTGTSYYHEAATQQSQIITNTDTLNTIFANNPAAGNLPLYSVLNGAAQELGIPVNLFGAPWQENMNNVMTSKSYAFYGDAIWHLTSNWNLTTGVRYTHDTKDFSWYNPPRTANALDANLATLNAANFFPTLVGAGALTAAQAAQAQYALTNNIEYNNPLSSSSPYSASNSWSDVSPRVVLDYKLSPDMMVFASMTKGYQSGGFNGQYTGTTYQPETVHNYEIGLKSNFLDNHVVVDASLFYYKFDNFQSLTLVSNNSAIPQYQITTSNQQAQGVDLDVKWKATRNLRLYGVGEYIDQDYDGTYIASDGTNLSNAPVGTPFWSAAGGIDYTQREVWNGSVDYSLQQSYTARTRCNADSENQGTCLYTPSIMFGNATQHTDGRIGWDAGSHKWGIALYVTNMLNKRYITGIDTTSSSVLGTPAAQISAPRMIGLQMHVSL
jgi:iron complex outermembrane receptor protein